LLLGCVEYDTGRHGEAESTRRAALSLGAEAGDAGQLGWAHEMRAWYSLTRGDYLGVIAAAETGRAITHGSSAAVQLAAQEAKAWARLGDRQRVEIALNQGRETLEALPYPEDLDNHFVVDPSKFDFYAMDCYRRLGEDNLAISYAAEVIRSSIDSMGVDRKPMRTAEARITLGVAAARSGDLEAAAEYGRQALAEERKSLPSLLMVSGELAAALSAEFPGEPPTVEYLQRLREVPET
jgi:tetratricopeptide (TPR) repeat protein